MLVLTRKVGEELVINGNIKIKIVSVKGDRIRVGVEAPTDVAVNRAEIHQQLQPQLVPAGACEDSVDLGAGRSPSEADTRKF